MSTYKSYIDRFQRSKSQKRDTSFDARLNPDKESYTQFLEVQLERISQALLHVDSFSDKVESVFTQVNSLEEKLNNSNKLVKLLQSFADGQEADNVKVQEKLAELSRKITDVNSSNDKKYVKESDLEALDRRLESLERRMERQSHTQNNTKAYASTEYPSEYQSENPKAGKEFEQRIMDMVNTKVEGYLKTFKGLEEKIEEKNDKFSEDIAMDIRTLENRMSEFINRAGERFPHPITGFNDRALDDIKEDFYQKIEGVMEELKNMPTLLEIEELKTLLEKEVVERKESLEQIEKYLYLNEKQSTNVTEDVAHKIEEFDVKLQDLELMLHRSSPRLTDKGEPLPSFPERKFAEEIRKLQSAVKDLYAKGEQSPNKSRPFSTSTDQANRDEIYELEKRLTDHMVDGFDRFSQMIKKHMDKAKKLERGLGELDQRVGFLEENLPSRSRDTDKRPTNKNTTTHSDHGTPKDLLATKENPFLRGRLTSESKMNTLQTSNSPKKKELTGETSFGDRFGKLRNSQNFGNSIQSDLENSKKSVRDRKKERRSRNLRSRSRSVSAKSLNESFVSSRSGKENKSPGLKPRNENYNSRKSSAKKSRNASPSASASTTPKRRHSLKSPQSFASVGSQKKRTSDVGGRGSTNIQAMQNKIEMERKQREEKIKKLLKNSKPAIDTPKFQPKEQQQQSTKGGNKGTSGTKAAPKQAKNKLKI